MLVWSHPDHFLMSVHPQGVCDHSWCLCEVILTILQCLHPQEVCDHSWSLCEVTLTICNVCVSSGSVWSFLMLVWSHTDHCAMVCASSVCVWSFLMLVWSHPDKFTTSVHPQLVCDSWCLCEVTWSFFNVCASSGCADHSWCLCELTLTILQCLCISGSEWSFLMIVWSHSDHFAMSVHSQHVCDHSWCLHEVTLTILQCLCTLREYVIILDAYVKSHWPFCNVCASSVCAWSFLMLVWSHPDHFAMSVHPQGVCNHSWCLCEVTLTIVHLSVHPQLVCDHSWSLCKVTLTILQCLWILSMCVIILDSCVKSPWPFCNVCGSSGSVWSFLMLVGSHPDHL